MSSTENFTQSGECYKVTIWHHYAKIDIPNFRSLQHQDNTREKTSVLLRVSASSYSVSSHFFFFFFFFFFFSFFAESQ